MSHESPIPHPRPTTALATSPADCAAQLRAILNWGPEEKREIRILGEEGAPRHAVVSTPEEAASSIRDVSYGAGVYITINPIRPSAAIVTKVASTLVRTQRGGATSDADIERRTRFVIDIDPVRPTNTSATAEQLAEAEALATSIAASLVAEGWPRPTQVRSGNGVHLYYTLNLAGESDLPSRALTALDRRFSTASVKVDTTVGNASRIMRLPGTWTAKDDRTDLHRVAMLEAVGEDRVLTPELLEAMAPHAPVPASDSALALAQAASNQNPFDVDAWLAKHGVKHRGKEAWPGGGTGAFRWVVDVCAFNPTHSNGEAAITQHPNGAVGYTCHHDSCSEYGWREFRQAVEAASSAKGTAQSTTARTPYPVDALPPLLQDVVRIQVLAMDVDEASVAVPMMTAMLGTIGNSIVVMPWTGWCEAMVAWTMLVAPSGQMKSATLGFAERALHELEAGFPTPAEDEPRERLLINDTTVEALVDVAAQHPRGLILFRDELASHLWGIGQYKQQAGGDEAFWLAAYEGKSHTVDRRSTGTTHVRRLLVSVFGGIQPTVLQDTLRARRRMESGFAARCWMVMPPRRKITLKPPSQELSSELQAIHARVRRCLESFRCIPMQDGMPTVLRMNEAAVQRLVAFANAQQDTAHSLHEMSPERAFREKSRGWVAKLAGLVALNRGYEAVGPTSDEDPTTPDYASLIVEEADVEAAIRLVEWQIDENCRTHKELQLDLPDRDLDHQSHLAHEAMDASTGVVTIRSYSRKHQVESAEAARILNGLVTAKRWGVRFPKPGPTGGRPTAQYFPLGDACLN
jgi:Protein of unknown function (DUF3987)